jgi:hypothetical protein
MTAPSVGQPIGNSAIVGTRSPVPANAEHQSWSEELARAQQQHRETTSHLKRSPQPQPELRVHVQPQKVDVPRSPVVNMRVPPLSQHGGSLVGDSASTQVTQRASAGDAIPDNNMGKRIRSDEPAPKQLEHARGHRVTAPVHSPGQQRSHGRSEDKVDPVEQASLLQQMTTQIARSAGLPPHAVRVVSLESLAPTSNDYSGEAGEPAPHRRRSEEAPRAGVAPHALALSNQARFAQNDSVPDANSSAPLSVANELQPVPEPIRLHANWSTDGVRLWLGLDSSAQVALQPIATQLQRWLNNQGHKLLSLNCNGQVVIDGANEPLHRPNSNNVSTPSHHFEETK